MADDAGAALRDSLPLVLPSWSLPVFFGMNMDEKLRQNDKTEAKPAARKQR